MSSVPTSASRSTLPRRQFSESSVSAHGSSARATSAAALPAALNPLAKEFVPAEDNSFAAAKSPTQENLAAAATPTTTTTTTTVLSDVCGVKENSVIQRPDASPSTPGGITAAFKGLEPQGKTSLHASSTPGRRGHNANHLLNFQYDPILRAQPRAPPPRRQQQKLQAYDKELFLQANFRFLVSDLGDYLENSTDPDKMIQWEDIALVELSSSVPVQCPICLDSPPLCPQITSCGHVFCFPCVLRYFTSGGEDSRADYWKKCPLCFTMTSCRQLRTVHIQSVKQMKVGETINFTLLTRAKGSAIPQKNNEALGSPAVSEDGRCHLYSKFTLTSDIEKTTSIAISELTAWAEKAQVGDSEELGQLPYVFAAIDQLKMRKAAWDEHRTLEFVSSSPPVRQRIMAKAKAGMTKLPGIVRDQEHHNVEAAAAAESATPKKKTTYRINPFTDERELVDSSPKSVKDLAHGNHVPDEWESISNDPLKQESAEKESAGVQRHEESDSYSFYQAADGQLIIIHPINMKCLVHHYGSYKCLPLSLEGKVRELETVIQTEASRKRYRYLSHLPLTSIFQLCEVDLSEVLPRSSLSPFREELNARENRRQRRLKQERLLKSADERAEERQVPPSPADFIAIMTALQEDEVPSNADFADSVVPAPVLTPSPPVNDRRLFSRVAKLGYAAGHDAPDLIAEVPSNKASSWKQTADAGSSAGRATLSFADVIQKEKDKIEEPSVNRGPNKGKKSQRILLSTSGGRKYY